MFLNEFNQTSISRIASLNKMLSDEFGIKINPGTVNLEKLMKINKGIIKGNQVNSEISYKKKKSYRKKRYCLY